MPRVRKSDGTEIPGTEYGKVYVRRTPREIREGLPGKWCAWYKHEHATLRDEQNNRTIPGLQRNLGLAKRTAREWAKKIESGTIARAPRYTMKELMDEFIEVRHGRSTQSVLNRVSQSFDTFIPEDLPVSDEAIYQHLKRRLVEVAVEKGRRKAEPLSPSTIYARIVDVRSFIAFCRKRRALKDDPFDLLPMPELTTKGSARILTPDEWSGLLEWTERYIALEQSRNRRGKRSRNAEQYRNLWPWQRRSAMRIGETVQTWWEESCPDRTRLPYISTDRARLEIPISKNGSARTLHIDYIPGLRELVDLQVEYREHNEGKLFPWTTSSTINDRMNEFLDEKGIDPGPLRTHILRSNAKADWRATGIPPWLANYWAGHDENTSKKAYTADPTQADLDAVFGPASAPTS